MNAIRCPHCNRPLPTTTSRCTHCGTSVVPSALDAGTQKEESVDLSSSKTRVPIGRRVTFFPMRGIWWGRKYGRVLTTPHHDLAVDSLTEDDPFSTTTPPEEQGTDVDTLVEELRPLRQTTWRKEVPSSGRVPVYPPRPIIPSKVRTASPVMLPRKIRFHPRPLFWVSCVAMVVMLATIGVLVALGRGFAPAPSTKTGLSLQITPHEVTIGATLSLKGSGFSPRASIGLTRGAAIPIINTIGNSIIQADSQGNFNDTVVVQAEWGIGVHTISAEDAITHKTASFPILVTGKSDPSRPAHLKLSTQTLDLGTGDQATNSKQTVMLSNQGGGQISWRSTTTQSWLKISPESSTIYSGIPVKISIAADRANLAPGPYSAQVLISSSAGNASIAVTMQVTKLNTANKAVLQVTPALLSFTSRDGGANPAPQVVTISNPGVKQLEWTASTSESWLSVSTRTGKLNAQQSSTLSVLVDTRTLLPGTHSAELTVRAKDPNSTLHTPQSIEVNVTITPRCGLTLSPAILSFTSAERQPAPVAQTIDVKNSNGCSGALSWQVSTSASWLTINTRTGTTPGKVSVGVNVNGLKAGTYNETLTFSSSVGTQTVPVKFVLGPANGPVLSIKPPALSFTGTIGTANPARQAVTITNNGTSPLSWRAATSTGSGGAWLSASPTSGKLSPNQSATIQVSTQLLASLPSGAHNGLLNISGTDDGGRVATGSPQEIPITFTVRPPCGLTVNVEALRFDGAGGQPAPPGQGVRLGVGDTCAHDLAWTAQVATQSGGNWLTVSSNSGTVAKGATSTLTIDARPGNLPSGTYTGTVTLSATDRTTGATVVAPQPVRATLNMSEACTLQAPTPPTLHFDTIAGTLPQPKTFTLGVMGTCEGGVTITPTLAGGANWLRITPTSTTINPGQQATFTATVNSTTLPVGQHTETISLTGMSRGITIVASPQTVAVALNVGQPPTLVASPTTLNFGTVTLTESLPVTLSNTGTGSLNWNAALATGAPAFLSLSTTSGNGLTKGENAAITVTVDAGGQASGTYTTSLILNATDAATGQAVAGSPLSIPITLTIPPPALSPGATSVAFETTENGNPAGQTVHLTNSGGGVLNWTVGPPSETWLSVTPVSGSYTAGESSNITFTVNTGGLAGRTAPYNATVTVTPSTGAPVTITVSLSIQAPAPTPTATTTGGGGSPTTIPPTTTPTQTNATNEDAPTLVALPTATP